MKYDVTKDRATPGMVRAAKQALDVQSACNLSGIVRSFAKITEVLWLAADAQGQGTDWVNGHPICRLFAEQILFLSRGGPGGGAYSIAYKHCERLAEEDCDA